MIQDHLSSREEVNENDSLHKAAARGDIAKLEYYVNNNLENGYPDRVTLQLRDDFFGAMPLHMASEAGQLNIIKYLIHKKVDLDAGDDQMTTALHLACDKNEIEIIKHLIKSGADVNRTDKYGDAPIHWTVTKGHKDILLLLIENNAIVDKANKNGWTPLHKASYNGRIQCLEILLKNGANVLVVNGDGDTALHMACKMNRLDVIECLMRNESNTEIKNNELLKPIELSSPNYRTAIEDIIQNNTRLLKLKISNRGLLMRSSITSQKSLMDNYSLSKSKFDIFKLINSNILEWNSEKVEKHPSFGMKDESGFPLVLENQLGIERKLELDEEKDGWSGSEHPECMKLNLSISGDLNNDSSI